ncbi:hypothetical protein EYF80_043336 [Liparis tanakae]|uniref:Uncharacterized protein n=1 Tax=Liparis tanakae TaxID=230148 RepID=A0A4Z2FYU3_9TELE|nr:hypothetical protein EYF80_043336 [Liparis tanakae]
MHCISLRFSTADAPSCTQVRGQGSQHVLGTLGVDEAVGGVQRLGLVHPLRRLFDVAGVLREKRIHRVSGASRSNRRAHGAAEQRRIFTL